MSKSKARFLAELLNDSGRVKKDKSDLAGADSIIDLDTLPTITNAKLENSSISIAGHSTALGGSVSLNTGDITEHTDYLYYTDARARSAISVSGNALSYNSSTGVISSSYEESPTFTGNVTASNLSVTSTNFIGFGDYGERISGSNAASTLTFYTNATQALQLDSSQNATFYGDVSIPVGERLYFGGSSHTYISEDIDDRLRFFVGGAEFMRFSEDTSDSAGIYVPTTFTSDVTISGNLSVTGTTTTIDTANLNVEDKNITLNYSTGDSSANADGAGITIQDAVDSSTDATILWDATNDEFDFSHGATFNGTISSGAITSSGNVILGNQADIDMDATSSGQLEIRGNAYTGAIALNDEHMNIYHNSATRGIVFGTNETARVAIKSSGEVEFYHNQSVFDATRWYVSQSDLAHQRVDVRDDNTDFSRAHWYGVRADGATSNFRHAWYDGTNYINVTAQNDGIYFQPDNTNQLGLILKSTSGASNPVFMRMEGRNSSSQDFWFEIANRGNHATSTFTDKIDFNVHTNGTWYYSALRFDLYGGVETKQHIGNGSSPYAGDDRYFKFTNDTASTSGTLVTADNGNTWLNADGGKDLWLNWYSLNSSSSKADLQVGDGDGGSAIFTVDATNRRVGVNDTSPSYPLDVAGDIRGTGTVRADSGINAHSGKISTTSSNNSPSGGNLEIFIQPDGNDNHKWRLIAGGTNTGYGTGAGNLGFYYQDPNGGNTDYNLILKENQTSRFFGRVDIDHSNLGAEPYSGLIITNTQTSGSDKFTGVTLDAQSQTHYRYKLNGALKWQTKVGAGNGTDDFRLYSWTTASDILTVKPQGEGQLRFFKEDISGPWSDTGTATGALSISGYGGQGGTSNPTIAMSANQGDYSMFYLNRIFNGATKAFTDGNTRYFDFYRDGSSKMRMVMESDDDFGFYHVSSTTTFNVWTSGGTNALRVEDTGTTALSSLNVTGAATVSSNNIFHAGYSNTWAQIPAGTRTNYTLKLKPASDNYAGFQFVKEDGDNAGYLLIRANSDVAPNYKANGISLIADGSWLSLVQRTTTNTGIRFLTGGGTPVERLTISSAGVIDAPSATWNRTYHQEDPALNGFNRDVHTHWGVLCAGSKDGAPSTYTVIETNIDQDSYRMGGFTILIMDNYGSVGGNSGTAARTRARIDLAGYWNPESNGGFMGWNYTTTNPRERPEIYVMRNSTTGKTAFAYKHSPVTSASYPIIVACDLWIGYSGASEADGKNWSISQESDLNDYTNSDQVNYVGGNGNYQDHEGKFVISKASGTMFSHASVGDAIGYNTAYGTYIGGSGGRYVYSGAASTHPVFYDGSNAHNILHNGGQIANTYDGDHTFTNTTSSAGIKVSNNQSGGPAIKIHSTNTDGTDWWLISNSSTNANGAGKLQLWSNNNSFTAATFGETSTDITSIYTPTRVNAVADSPTFASHTSGNLSPALVANVNGQAAHGLVVNQTNGGYWAQIISTQRYGLNIDSHASDSSTYLLHTSTAGSQMFAVRGDGVMFSNRAAYFGNSGNYPGHVTQYANSGGGPNTDRYAPNGSYAHHDARDAGNHAMLHKYTYSGSHGYGTYLENWWDGNSYHQIGSISDAIRTNGDFVASGNITAYGTYSDIRLKENVRPFENARELIKDIGVHRFNYIGKDDDLIGVIAQEVEQTLPQLVYELIDTDSDEVRKAVRYDHLSAVLLKVVKEQEEEINELKAMMQKILEKIND